MEQNEFKPFEMWRDHFGLAELVQSGKLRDEKQGDKEEIVSVPEKQPKYIQMQVNEREKGEGHENACVPVEQPDVISPRVKTKLRKAHKLCFARVPYRRPQCTFCKSIHHLIRGPRGKSTCPVLRNRICPICKATGDDAHSINFCPKYH